MAKELLRRAGFAEQFAQLSEDFNPYVKRMYELRTQALADAAPHSKDTIASEFRRVENAVRDIQHSLNRLATWSLTGRVEVQDDGERSDV